MLINDLEKLFGSGSRVKLIELFLNNENEQYQVNEAIRKTGINARMVSVELKKLRSVGLLTSKPQGNALLYKADKASPLFEPLKSMFVKQDWLEWERPSRIHHLVLTLEAGLKPMKEYYGHCLPYAHLIFNYDNVTWFFKLSEFKDVGQKLLLIYQKKKRQIWEDFNTQASLLWDHRDYSTFYKNYINFWKIAYITEPISFYIDSLLKPQEHITLRSKSFTDEYEDRIWELSRQAEKVGLEKVDVKQIVKDYSWIRNSYHSIHRFTEEEARIEVSKKVGKKRPKQEAGQDPKSIPQELIEIGKDLILMQDTRKKIMMKAAFYIHEYIKEIGKKHGLTLLMMDQTLPSEVLHKGVLNEKIKSELITRQRSCTIIGSLSDGIKVFSGQIFFPTGLQRKTKFEIRGNVACGGKAVGRVKVVTRAEEIYKVNHGDVIVAPMTSPDFMPAIRRCVGIITNFGGITCHAAIISREFNIPCIVATNNATELLNDGDLVEIDADSGVVKILESK